MNSAAQGFISSPRRSKKQIAAIPKPATTVLSLRVDSSLKSLLSDLAKKQEQNLSGFVEALLRESKAVRNTRTKEAAPRTARRWALAEIEQARLSQLAVIGLGIDRLVDAIHECTRHGTPVDLMRLIELVDAILQCLHHLGEQPIGRQPVAAGAGAPPC